MYTWKTPRQNEQLSSHNFKYHPQLKTEVGVRGGESKANKVRFIT